jgi:hypothetical protein
MLPRWRYGMVGSVLLGGGIGVFLVLSGCGVHFSRSSIIFPPQIVMKNGNYKEFLVKNEERVEECREGIDNDSGNREHKHRRRVQEKEIERAACDESLFNLGFVYAYPESPYQDWRTALPYFDELIATYPESPWAFQGLAWITLVEGWWAALEKEGAISEEKQERLRDDLLRSRAQLRSREATIRTLQGQLQRLRELDIQMEKRERELLR